MHRSHRPSWRATSPCCILLCRFFFQAEDGIRDTSVTGVQTCALPIYRSRAPREVIGLFRTVLEDNSYGARLLVLQIVGALNASVTSELYPSVMKHLTDEEERSEERRVGKECRARGYECSRQRQTDTGW